MSNPIPLSKANLSHPFVYERRWGVFYVPNGKHQAAMSVLLAFQHNLQCGIDVAEKLNLEYSAETADYWLEHTPGAAFLSSVSKKIQIANFKLMTAQERRAFSNAACCF